jgi:hypothetical protein
MQDIVNDGHTAIRKGPKNGIGSDAAVSPLSTAANDPEQICGPAKKKKPGRRMPSRF